VAKGKKKCLWGQMRPDFFSWAMKKGKITLTGKSRSKVFTGILVITGAPSNNYNNGGSFHVSDCIDSTSN